jgi:hypothetical protein
MFVQVLLAVIGTSLEAADSTTKENPVWSILSQTLDSFLFPPHKPNQVRLPKENMGPQSWRPPAEPQWFGNEGA